MAKLNKDLQAKTAAAEVQDRDFTPAPPAVYPLRLREVDTDRPAGAKGPYWVWVFEIAGGEHDGKRIWTNTSLSENALWKLKEIFNAFGVDTDADTDELCGKIVKGVVVVTTIQTGDKKGEQRNEIRQFMPADEETLALASTSSAGPVADAEEDIF